MVPKISHMLTSKLVKLQANSYFVNFCDLAQSIETEQSERSSIIFNFLFLLTSKLQLLNMANIETWLTSKYL